MAKIAPVCSFVNVRRNPLRRLARCGVAACIGIAVLGAGAPAVAQSLPPVSTERLSDSQRSQVSAYVAARLTTLENADPSSVESARARRELIEPMRTRETSVAMRQEFAQAASSRLQAMATSPVDQRAVNALLVAGNIGDQQSVAIIEAGLNDEREAVKIGAAAGAKAMLRVIDGRLGGAQAGRQREVQRLLGDALAVAQSGHVAQSLIGALTALPEDAPFMAVSSGLIAEAMSIRAPLRRQAELDRAMENGWAGAMERSVAAQLAYLRNAAIAGTDVNRESQMQGARVAGIALSLVRDLLDDAPEAERAQIMSEYARLVRASETLLVLVQSNLTPGANGSQVMGDLISRENTDGLIEAIDRWTGSRGVLLSAPFSFRASDFGR